MTEARMMTVEQRVGGRHLLGRFVAPRTKAGTNEGYLAVDISREGMSLLRSTGSRGKDEDKRGLDYDHGWLAIPLPERGRHVCALAEVVYRRSFGPLEAIGVRFHHISDSDRAILDEYLAERETLSFGAAQVKLA